MAFPNQRRAILVLLVLSGLIISICMGLRQSLGLFMDPRLDNRKVKEELGGTHAAIRIPLTRFAQLTGATWVDVCKEM